MESEALTLHRSHKPSFHRSRRPGLNVDPGDPRLKIISTLGPKVDNYLHWTIWIPRAVSKP